jgi:hypothetical protein
MRDSPQFKGFKSGIFPNSTTMGLFVPAREAFNAIISLFLT